MRNAFAAELTDLAAEDQRLVLLSGDIGNRLFDNFKKRSPERFLNCGVAEANMMGIAAGMAMSGVRPVAYTIASFVTFRCFEQIRVDVCYHRLPVVIVGVGSGLSYAPLGGTHHSCEDVAVMRALPGMTVFCPADAWEVRGALRAALAHDGPSYIRIGTRGEPTIHDAVPALSIGKAIPLREGRRVCLLATGVMVHPALEAARRLEADGVSAGVVSMPTVKPLDVETVRDAFSRFELIVTLEEHSVIGGLGSAVAEWLADAGPQPARLCRFATPDQFYHASGERSHLHDAYGLSPEAIATRIARRLHDPNPVEGLHR